MLIATEPMGEYDRSRSSPLNVNVVPDKSCHREAFMFPTMIARLDERA